MKVLVFTSLFPNQIWPQHGVFVKERMVHVAREEGCDLKVIAPVPYFPAINFGKRFLYSQVPKQETIEGLEVHHPRYLLIPKIGMPLHGLGMFQAAWPLARKIQQRFDFDLIDSHYIYPDGFAAVLLGRCMKKPVVLTARGSDINQFSEFPVIRKLIRFALTRAAKIIAVSDGLRKKMMELGVPGEKIVTIGNGVDQRKFHPLCRQEVRRQLGLPEKKILLSVGGLKPVKGFDLLIRAMKILADKHHFEDILLVICGDGESRHDLENLVASLDLQGKVRFTGSIPHENLCLWYSAANLFCLASSREGCPNVVLEAMACGLPVIATPVGGIPDLIVSEKLGLLAHRNENDIADKLVQALKKDWQVDDLLTFARDRTWSRVAKSVVDIFRSTAPVRESRKDESGS